ncbi:hypothetical protein [Aggregatilinea lenta]|uniref:hypothetical protein n=1 Tax=Aggregatilinea lenta TaxID=913108 RepID=UPI000E5BF359|nr:hypothetical protein [Aggregatilinea lenta]
MPSRPPETEARRIITVMLVLTGLVVVITLALPWSVTVRSVVLIAWIAVMMAVLRRYRLDPPDESPPSRRSKW